MNWFKKGLISDKHSYSLCLDEKEYIQTMKKFKISNYNDFLLKGSNASVHHFENGNDGFSILCIEKIENPIMMIGLVVHEAKHIHDYNMELIGEMSVGNEVCCYCLQLITQTLLNELAIFKMEYKK